MFAILKATPNPTVAENCWLLADEIIDFYRDLPTLPEYKSVMERLDGAMIGTCIEAAAMDEITPLTFAYAVLMPHMYGKIRPSQPVQLNPLKTEARIIKPGEFMGTLNVPDRFFVKLVHVGINEQTKGGHLFEVRDRNDNVGFFYDKANKFEEVIQLSDCFAIHGTPIRHTPAPNGEKHTIFRNVTVVEFKGTSPTLIPKEHDLSGGKFTKNYVF